MATINKIKQILHEKQLSPSQFADAIGVPRSSISHILSGRNRPSLDIIQKISRRYPDFTYNWLLDEVDDNEADSILATGTSHDRKHELPAKSRAIPLRSSCTTDDDDRRGTPKDRTIVPEQRSMRSIDDQKSSQQSKQVDRILIFYTDGTFREYLPA
jgi:transcriptional regulator with XRE-family HTH domain